MTIYDRLRWPRVAKARTLEFVEPRAKVEVWADIFLELGLG